MRVLGTLVGGFLAVAAASASWAADIPNTLGDRARSAALGRRVQVNLAQRHIEPTIEIGRVASSANGGGLIGAILISSMDDKRDIMRQAARERAEATIAPLRQSLQGFDIDSLALTTTRSALAKLDWFRPTEILLNGTAPAAPAPASQSALIIYRYETSPDFTQIRVIADVRLAETASAQGSAATPNPFYHQQISSIVVLRARSFEGGENVARWSADNGRLAKAALTGAFARLEQLIPFALDLKETDVKAITARNRMKVFAAGFYGPAVERPGAAPGESLIWKDGLISVAQSTE